MTLEEGIRDLIRGRGQKAAKSASLERLEAFYVRMKSRGLLRRAEYALPPLDTVGRGAALEDRTREEHAQPR